MPMLYDVFYWTARTGRRLAGLDRCTFGVDRAPKGELAQMVNVNWDGHVVWVDDQGREVGCPDFALDDFAWVDKHLAEIRFADPSHRDVVKETLEVCFRDIQARHRYAPEFASLRRRAEAGGVIALYARRGG